MHPKEDIEIIKQGLGLPKDYQPAETSTSTKYSIEALKYLHRLLKKGLEEKLTFIEAVDAYAESSEGRGIYWDLFGERGKILFDKIGTQPPQRPYLEWGQSLPTNLKDVLEKKIHDVYEKKEDTNVVKTIINSARDLFYKRLLFDIEHWKMMKAEYEEKRKRYENDGLDPDNVKFRGIPTNFSSDGEKNVANLLYTMFHGKSYHLWEPIIRQNGRLKILIELGQRSYLLEKQLAKLEEVKKTNYI